ncbi:MAG: 3-ketoacyl-ACP reductase [bacterium]|nr:MAG: 3-ketoacyl-ACP reductase [bacterium]
MKDIALVTGASRGIGKAIALKLAEKGYHIWLNYNKDTKSANETKDQIIKLGKDCKLLQFDVASKDRVREVLTKEINNLDKEKERIAVLVNNAGIVKDALFYWMRDEEWEDVINTNLNSLFYVTKAVIESMILNKHGYIVNLSSLSGEAGNMAQANYSASKAGIIGATKSLAKEMARSNILINVVSPGLIESDMTQNLKDNKNLIKSIPMKRFGRPEEVANVVAFLCSSESSYISGAVIPVNGALY